MPNWCSNEVAITGSAEDIKVLHKLLGDKMDFNKIIPMPEELHGTKSPTTILSQEDYDKAVAERMVIQAKEEKTVHDNMVLNCGIGITQEMSDTLVEKYGFNNWYEWSVNNWGTKWNIGNDEGQGDWGDTSVHFTFYTAWSPPEPIYNALAEKYPNLDIDWNYEEEGMGFRGNFSTGEYQEEI